MLYHQNSTAQVNAGSRRAAASHTFSPPTSRFDCRQSHTSARSRKYQPLATQPWPAGGSPVVNVACAEHVTAGRTVRRGRTPPSRASAARCGVASPTRSGVSPTTSRTTVRRTRGDPGLAGPGPTRSRRRDHRRLAAKDRVALEELALVDPWRRGETGAVELAALGEERDGVLPHDATDVRLGDPGLAHRCDRLRHLERIAHAPIG